VFLYFARKLALYCFTFVCAVTINWTIPHAMPGNPIMTMIYQRFGILPDSSTYNYLFRTFGRAFRPDIPLWKQYYYYYYYYYYWYSLFHGNIGISVVLYPASVFRVIGRAAPYTLGLLIPAILLSWYAGNKVGALAARRKVLDNSVLPVSYALAASPYMWFATILSWLFAYVWRVFPGILAYDPTMIRQWSFPFILNLLYHWFLPFMSVFLLAFGSWAIGMRSMIIYELDSDYARYLEALGASRRLLRRYTYRNALLPQVSNLSLQLGAIMGGALVTEMVFAYPGLGFVLYRGLIGRDLFLVQGIFLVVIVCVLVINFLADIAFVLVDPRTRIGMQGGEA
jgi:peptide/nickel transport system permease protein